MKKVIVLLISLTIIMLTTACQATPQPEKNKEFIAPAIDSYGIEGNEAINQYSEFWRNEYAEVTVDDTGVLTINYFSPSKVVEIINDNVELMSFDKIMERLETQMQIGGAWYSSEDIESREIEIDKITLGLCRIANKDKQGEYLLVPAWDFFGQCTEIYKDGSKTAEEYKEFVEDEFGHSYLTINAIDGSIIDRNLGY